MSTNKITSTITNNFEGILLHTMSFELNRIIDKNNRPRFYKFNPSNLIEILLDKNNNITVYNFPHNTVNIDYLETVSPVINPLGGRPTKQDSQPGG